MNMAILTLLEILLKQQVLIGRHENFMTPPTQVTTVLTPWNKPVADLQDLRLMPSYSVCCG
jgi:hypothetical protein